MIRVLQCVNNMHRAGLETMLMNYYRNIDRTQIQFDFLTHRPQRSDYDDEIESLGGRVYYAPRLYPQHYAAYFSFMRKFFLEHPEYQIMHSHIDTMSYLPLLAGKKAGVPVRIAHSHNTGIDRDFKYPIKRFFHHQILNVTTHRCACGNEAGQFLFGDHDFTVIPNAIETRDFRFDQQVRAQTRKALQLDDRFVVGHVGRFAYAKNHLFLLEIFQEVLKQRNDAVLLLVGKGEKEEAVRQKTAQLGLKDHVRFLGSRNDVNHLYQAMDVFVMPSLFEGLPVTGVEAQFAQLPCVFSDRITTELEFSDLCRFVSLDESPAVWAQEILRMQQSERGLNDISDSRYDIRNAQQLLTDYYLQLMP